MSIELVKLLAILQSGDVFVLLRVFGALWWFLKTHHKDAKAQRFTKNAFQPTLAPRDLGIRVAHPTAMNRTLLSG